jgi:hypothetical protein
MSWDISRRGSVRMALAASAHLQSVPGLEIRVFGEPMEFWA